MCAWADTGGGRNRQGPVFLTKHSGFYCVVNRKLVSNVPPFPPIPSNMITAQFVVKQCRVDRSPPPTFTQPRLICVHILIKDVPGFPDAASGWCTASDALTLISQCAQARTQAALRRLRRDDISCFIPTFSPHQAPQSVLFSTQPKIPL